MKLRIPFFLTLAGYLTVVLGTFFNSELPFSQNIIGTFWAIGIGMHMISAILFWQQPVANWQKWAFALVPVPLGFVMTIGGMMYYTTLPYSLLVLVPVGVAMLFDTFSRNS